MVRFAYRLTVLTTSVPIVWLADGADRVGANRQAADGADRVGANRLG
ncbi:hypothetical protein A244_24869 [Pseudomonas syringae pv. actinidiae ICMP 18807]|uniref:Uncharacterized protein n=1 Tax=Pseudomonas syringae pv. actinidiae ICMP 18807 TaxID=1194404 RepID=S6TQB7_PSESF|nr:hypothetical protein A244_24869 [Pseudomonas syringae pv. actinidiae ICMP 18807]